jgi:LPS sulfotransferase NodH
MNRVQRRFCVLTVGRAGSTSLMDCLAQYPDIAVPNKNIACIDQELTHPARIQAHAAAYAELCGRAITTPEQLIECFFEINSDAAFAGFKTMPNRHKDLGRFVARSDIQFVTLTRRDLASTVASFLVAMATESWRRSGEPQAARWQFDVQRDAPAVLGNLRYVVRSHAQLNQVRNAIALVYEDLCDPGFFSKELDAFFGRGIRLCDPKPPTSAEAYVANWQEFHAFVDQAQRQMTAVAPRAM